MNVVKKRKYEQVRGLLYLERRTKLKLHVLEKFLLIFSNVWAMVFETFVGNVYQNPREICATSGTKSFFLLKSTLLFKGKHFLKSAEVFTRTVLSIVPEKYCNCNATRVPFRVRVGYYCNGSND